MNNKKATAEVQPAQKNPTELKLVRMPSDHGAAPRSGIVSQLRLARIQQLQAEVAYLQMQLSKEWDGVRNDLLQGAIVEKGPLRAWIKCILRLGRAKAIDAPQRKISKT